MKTDFPSNPKAVRIYHDNNDGAKTHMFREDVASSIMPNRGESKAFPDFNAYIIGDEEDKQVALNVCESITGEKSYGNECNILSDVINSIGESLSWNGRSVYEIIYDKENKSFHAVEFSTKNLFHCLFWYIQIVLQSDRKKLFNVLQSEFVWQIKMPAELGGKKGYESIISNLTAFDSLGPTFYLQDIQTQINHYFDFSKYQHNYQIYMRKSTIKFGWNSRNLDNKYKTEFYMFHHLLTFRWAKSVIRDHIVLELNQLFKKLELNVKIVVEGLPTPDEILQFRQQLVDGEKTFHDVNQYVYY